MFPNLQTCHLVVISTTAHVVFTDLSEFEAIRAGRRIVRRHSDRVAIVSREDGEVIQIFNPRPVRIVDASRLYASVN